MAYKNKFDQPYYLKPDDNTPEMNDILSIGREGDLFKLKKESLIKKIPVNVSDNNNNNLFHLILKEDLKKTQTNIINFFKYLINNNTNPEQPNFQNRTPLHYACMNHYNIIIKYLLDIGCNPNFKDNFGMTPMHYYMGGKIELYKDTSPKPFKNYKNNLDIKTNKEFASLHREVHDFISYEYRDYFRYFNKIIVSITAQDKKYANDITRIVEALDGNVSDVTSREDRTKELLTRAKKIRSIFEGAIVNVFNPKEIGARIMEETKIKRYDDETNNNNIYPALPVDYKKEGDDEKCKHFFIFKDFNLTRKKDDLIEEIKAKINKLIADDGSDNESDNGSDNGSDDGSDDDSDDGSDNESDNGSDNGSDDGSDDDSDDGSDDSSDDGSVSNIINNINNLIKNINDIDLNDIELNEIYNIGKKIKRRKKIIEILNLIISYINENNRIRLIIGLNGNDINLTRKKDDLIEEIKAKINKLIADDKSDDRSDDISDDGSDDESDDGSDDDSDDDSDDGSVSNNLIKNINDIDLNDIDLNEINNIGKKAKGREKIIEILNLIISYINENNRMRLIIDLIGLNENGNSDGNDINVRIEKFYIDFLSNIEDKEIIRKELYVNEYSEDKNLGVADFKTLEISNIVNQNKKSIDMLLEFFIKKIVHQFHIKKFFEKNDKELVKNKDKSKEINAFEKKISDIYDKTITFHDKYCNIKDLNKKKLLIGVITEVVTNHLATMVNNTINRLTISMMMMGSDTGALTDSTNILDIVDDDNIVFNFTTDMNDITFNIEKDDSKKIEKKFIMFSDDYSILEIEKELLELKIDCETFTHMLLKGATINEKDGNGRLPLDNIIDNKYYCIVDKCTEYGYKYDFMNHSDRIPSTLKYAMKSLVNHVKSFDFNSFTDNQYKDLKELIESSGDDYGFQMYKANKGSFEEINKHGRLIITNHIMISALISALKLKLPLGIFVDRYNLGITLELDKYEMGSINNLEEKISLISNKITLLEEIYKKCIEYFTGDRYYHTNTLKGDLYKLLYKLSKDIIKRQIELFIKKMITGYYAHNSTSGITSDQLNNIFSAGSMMKSSLNDSMDRMMELFIKNACQLFEDEDEKDSHNNRTAGDILGDFIDEFSLNSYVAIKLDSKLMKLLKKNVVGYFDNFVYRMLQNWMIVYENNLKFIINHYRLLKIVDSITK